MKMRWLTKTAKSGGRAFSERQHGEAVKAFERACEGVSQCAGGAFTPG
jgi:hypothetical protein